MLRTAIPIAIASLMAATLAVAQPAPRTIVNDVPALRRLRTNSGMTLQWIGFETKKRGRIAAQVNDGRVHLTGSQVAATGDGRVTIDGDVVAIDARHFTLRGRIVITDTPDVGRQCVRDGTFEFRVTGTRRYWRLQQMEACDGLTDYVDIYF
jgi:hypothetical protein